MAELAVLLACIVIGARLGGIALGTLGGIGLAIFVFGFGIPPGSPPGTVLGMILAVITALSMMEARPDRGRDLVATIEILAPIGVALGLPSHLLIGVYPAVNGNFFLPTN